MNVRISILVRTFNSEKTLPRLLQRLNPGPEDEILIVDSGSRDGTLAAAARYGAKTLVAPPPFNYSKSLNVGFRAAQCPWVLVISSHAVPMSDLLTLYRQAALGFPDDVVSAYGTTSIDRRPILDPTIHYFGQAELDRFIARCGNENAFYRRAAWEAYPFDETIRTNEDHLWLLNRAANGARFATVPQARVLNQNNYSLRYMFRKGYSDVAARPHEPMSPKSVFLTCGSLTKSLLFRRMPLGNWFRMMAHALGRFCGSLAPQEDNRPW